MVWSCDSFRMSRRPLQRHCTQAHFAGHGARARHGFPHHCRTCQARPSWLMSASLLSLCRHITGKLTEHCALQVPCEFLKVSRRSTTGSPSTVDLALAQPHLIHVLSISSHTHLQNSPLPPSSRHSLFSRAPQPSLLATHTMRTVTSLPQRPSHAAVFRYKISFTTCILLTLGMQPLIHYFFLSFCFHRSRVPLRPHLHIASSGHL